MSAATPMSIAQVWEVFRKMTIPAQASEAQVRDMRTAFYAGATALIAVTTEIASDEISEVQGMLVLSSLHREAHEFAAQLATEAALRGAARH